MKKSFYVITIAIFIAILVVPSLIWEIKLKTGSRIFETELGENRQLALWPDYYSESYISEVETYYNDHAPFRSVLIYAYSVCDSSLEGFYRKRVQPLMVKLSGKSGDGSYGNLAEMYNAETAEDVEEEITEEISDEPVEEAVEEVEEDPCAHGHDFEAIEVVEPDYQNYGYTVYRCRNCGFTVRRDFTEKLVDDTYLPENIANGQVIIGRNDWLFFIGNDSLSYYKGTNVMDEAAEAEKLASLQEIKNICDELGKTVVFAIWPNKEQVYPEYMPTYKIENVVKREQAFKIYVDSHSDVNFIYPIDELTRGKLFRDTYYPYDTHWNYWGAYLATMALYKSMGFPYSGEEDWEVTKIENVARGLVATGLLDPAGFTDDCDYFVNYRPGVGLTYSDGVKGLMSGYTPVYRAQSASPIFDEEIAIIGDSFRISMLDYMEKDFRFITAVQRDNINEAADDIRDSDIIVVSAVERFDPDFYRSLSKLKAILKPEAAPAPEANEEVIPEVAPEQNTEVNPEG